jgi:hypothetical protein
MIGHVARVGKVTDPHTILLQTPEGKDNLSDQVVHGIFILGWLLKNRAWEWGQGLSAGCCQHGNEPFFSVQVEAFPDQPSDCQNLKETVLHGVILM